MRKLEVGDRITVRKDLEIKMYAFGIKCTQMMCNQSGKKLKVCRIKGDAIYLESGLDDYSLNSSYDWSVDMFEDPDKVLDTYEIY